MDYMTSDIGFSIDAKDIELSDEVDMIFYQHIKGVLSFAFFDKKFTQSIGYQALDN